MKNKESAATTAATVNGGNAEQNAERTIQAFNSDPNFTTDNAKPQGFIESFLLPGESNAIRTDDLLKITGIDSKRTLRRMVEQERRNGALILTGHSTGYFLPGDGAAGKAEIERFYLIQRAKALSLLKTIKSAKEALSEIDGQMEMR